jgi:hypothetical protein
MKDNHPNFGVWSLLSYSIKCVTISVVEQNSKKILSKICHSVDK